MTIWICGQNVTLLDRVLLERWIGAQNQAPGLERLTLTYKGFMAQRRSKWLNSHSSSFHLSRESKRKFNLRTIFMLSWHKTNMQGELKYTLSLILSKMTCVKLPPYALLCLLRHRSLSERQVISRASLRSIQRILLPWNCPKMKTVVRKEMIWVKVATLSFHFQNLSSSKMRSPLTPHSILKVCATSRLSLEMKASIPNRQTTLTNCIWAPSRKRPEMWATSVRFLYFRIRRTLQAA